MEHKKTPWGCDGTALNIEGSYVVYGDSGDDDDEICIVSEMFADSIEHESAARANAEFIVKACNNHDALVEALKASGKFVDMVGNGNEPTLEDCIYMKAQIKEALEQAK